MKVYINGEIADPGEARVSLFDRGLAFGDGLYETMRVYNGRIFALENHLDRMRSGCSLLRLRVRTSENYWRPKIYDLLSLNGLRERHARVRITITRGPALDLAAASQTLPTEAIVVLPIDEEGLKKRWETGSRAIIAAMRRPPDSAMYRIKTLNMLPTVLARLECGDWSADEAFFLNTNEELCSATFSNVFLVKDGALITPALDSPCIPGITRFHVMALAARHKMETSERPVHRDEILLVDEIFTTSSITEITPVVNMDGTCIRDGKPGPITRQMQQWWREHIAKTIA